MHALLSDATAGADYSNSLRSATTWLLTHVSRKSVSMAMRKSPLVARKKSPLVAN